MAQRLAGSFAFRKHPDKDRTRQTYSVSINIHTGTHIHSHIAQTRALVESRCPGEPTRRGLGRSSPWTTGAWDNGDEWRTFRVVIARAPRVPLFCTLCLIGVETEGLLDYQGRAEIISLVWWNLRPVIFGVEKNGILLGEGTRWLWGSGRLFFLKIGRGGGLSEEEGGLEGMDAIKRVLRK